MNITREDVMSYSAIVGTGSIFLAGLAFDSKMIGLTVAFGTIAAGALVAIVVAYLQPGKN